MRKLLDKTYQRNKTQTRLDLGIFTFGAESFAREWSAEELQAVIYSEIYVFIGYWWTYKRVNEHRSLE